jgi:hypothetical protein
MADPFDLLLAHRTYEIFAAHWPYSEEPAVAPLDNATKYVASATLNSVEWQNSQLLEGHGDQGRLVRPASWTVAPRKKA